jgi:hypothetical protein
MDDLLLPPIENGIIINREEEKSRSKHYRRYFLHNDLEITK